MSKILIVAEHADGALNPSTHKCVSCASKIDGAEIHVLVLAEDASKLAAAAAQIDGVKRVLALSAAENAAPLSAVLAPQIVQIASGYSHVFGPSTTFGKDLMPRVAALLGEAQVSDIMAVEDAHTFQRPIYAGNAIVTVKADPARTVVATVRTASWPAAGEGGSAEIETVTSSAKLPSHTRFVELKAGGGDRPDLQSATRVVSGGRAFASKENFAILYSLADKMGAGVGASRAAVDAGYVPNDMQVGQTGKIIAPQVYFAFGISGAIQHLTGIKDAGTIVAVNKDSEAPIFEIADFGLVGDLFEVIPEIEKAL